MGRKSHAIAHPPELIPVPAHLLGTLPVWSCGLVEAEVAFYLSSKFWALHQLMFEEVDHRTFYLLWVEAVEEFVRQNNSEDDPWDTKNFFECVDQFGSKVKRVLRSKFARDESWIERKSKPSQGDRGESLRDFIARFEKHCMEFPEDAVTPEDGYTNRLY